MRADHRLYQGKLPSTLSETATFCQQVASLQHLHSQGRQVPKPWQADLLNPMGRTVLVNSVLDSLLVYLMSSLQLAPSAIEQMDKKRRAFLWSGDKSGHSSPSSCLITWFKVCSPKDFGGLGIRDLGIHNICLLLKLLHRLHRPQSSAWAIWVRGRANITTLQGDLHGDHCKP